MPTTDELAAIINRPAIKNMINRLTAITDATITTLEHQTDADLFFELPIAIATEFLIGFEICPIHHTHIEICIDDQLPECADLRARAGY